MLQIAKRARLAFGFIAVSGGLSACAAGNSPAGPQVAVVERIDGPYLLAGTDFDVELEQPLGTDLNRSGDAFVGRVVTPLHAPTGQEVVPKGARVTGTVTNVLDARIGLLALRFDRIETTRGPALMHATVESAGTYADVALVPAAKGSGTEPKEFDAVLSPKRTTAIGGGPPAPGTSGARTNAVRIPDRAVVRLVLLDKLIPRDVAVENPPRELVEPTRRTGQPPIQIWP